jgi:hypothetical protein
MADFGIIASVRHRLVNATKVTGVPNEILMRRYAFERMLVRMVETGHGEEFCLKGAMAFAAVTGDARRPTRDMDFSGRTPLGPDETLDIWRAIAAHSPAEDDGLTFLVETFRSEGIQEGSDEPGVRILGDARLGTARIPLKIEVSYGHALTPGAVRMEYPTILEGSSSPTILCYSKETMLAEKFEAACSLGVRTSRFKDFYDIRGLARSVDFDGPLLAQALRNTFERRGTPLPETDPDVFHADFADEGQRGWTVFLRKQGFKDGQTYPELVAEIRPLVMGAARMARDPGDAARWIPGTGWEAVPDQGNDAAPEEDRSFTPF